MNKKILYIDMDNVVVDFQSGIDALTEQERQDYVGKYDETPHIFSLMQPLDGALQAIERLNNKYDIYLLSTAPWHNPTAWSDKVIWVQKYLGEICYKRLILSHHKNLNNGDFLIDDREKNGAKDFGGKLLLFGSSQFPDWDAILKYLI